MRASVQEQGAASRAVVQKRLAGWPAVSRPAADGLRLVRRRCPAHRLPGSPRAAPDGAAGRRGGAARRGGALRR
eukprot:scaffold1581_cov342-Prasinococcus_capsulatus_cf.AAC.8